MLVVVIGPNLRDQSKGQFRVHELHCADVHKDLRLTEEQPWDLDEMPSRMAVVEELYPSNDFGYDPTDADDRRLYLEDVWFAPCLKSLPVEVTS
jgi:hypothetical protein